MVKMFGKDVVVMVDEGWYRMSMEVDGVRWCSMKGGELRGGG